MNVSPDNASFAVPAASAAPASVVLGARTRPRERASLGALLLRRPELWALLALSGVLNLWDLSRNGWANVYYSAAVRSMSSSWHDFLYAAFDRGGVMTVDKPPLALWVQALSVRAFGYHPLSVLVPQALMGMASVALVYDLVRRRFGRVGGFVAGLALALTPMTVAISRHNNPDALLVLACLAAVWCTVRGLEAGRTRWLVLAGVCVGLGFETKMGVALAVIPGIVAAWLWVAPAGRGRLRALRQLAGAGGAMALVAGAWPALVELTPAGSRPWVAGTTDNRVISLIFGYNGLGRVDGQAGGPVGSHGNTFGGATGPLRLLNAALGGQVGWLLGFALVTTVAMLLASRLRRTDPRSGWLLVVGGAFLVSAVLFSFASGIFHPYYVSLLAPFLAALVGAGAAQLLAAEGRARIVGPLAILAGVVVELVVRGNYPTQLRWLPPVLILAGVLAAGALLAWRSPRVRIAASALALVALLLAPGVWAVDTLGYSTSTTFPAGGPASAQAGGPGALGRGGAIGGPSPAGAPHLRGGFFGGAPSGPPPGRSPGVQRLGPPAGATGAFATSRSPNARAGSGAGAGPFGGDGASLKPALSYIAAHGGGTLAVSSQSSAASTIIASGASVAGIGGFSGRETEVSRAWLAQEVRSGRLRWFMVEEQGAAAAGAGGGAQSSGSGAVGGFPGGGSLFLLRSAQTGPPGETRVGARKVFSAVAKACVAVKLSATEASSGATLYDCHGDAAALAG
jgi:4-amino-4-deoxy-L-arabinose transferase-like glycosyltransferase